MDNKITGFCKNTGKEQTLSCEGNEINAGNCILPRKI